MIEGAIGPLISVVIPAYNAEQFVGEAIQSVLDQTYEIAEIIVVDDGSSDRTAEVAAAFPRTRVIRRQNGGPGAARNTGIHAATSEWIALLDSDDLWVPRKTEIQLECMAPDVGVIHSCPFEPITFGGLWHRQAFITPSGTLVRRTAFLEVGGFEESRDIIGVEDVNFWMKIALADWRFARSETGLFRYRKLGQSISSNEMKMARAELVSIDLVAGLTGCPSEDVNRVKQASRIEYAKNLIANHQWDEAIRLLEECVPGRASRWLYLACFLKMGRIARTNLVRWLQTKDGEYESHMCSSGCRLSGVRKAQCEESSRRPFFRP
jgi:glycosyltransferase involved in cell wall biosynthesis